MVVSNTALLVMDIQPRVVGNITEGADALLALVGRTAAAARAADIPVIYVRLAFRDGHPEISSNNKTFSASPSPVILDTPNAEIHDAVAPQPGDIVVTKKRVSAFTGSDLEVVLRSLGVTSLVLTGLYTSGVVLSTLCQAADMDYAITVLSDGCMDLDTEVHRVLVDKVFPRQATIVTADEWLSTV